jgi:predicted DCC family thiol-disulfide oxidoreductase YuxK
MSSERADGHPVLLFDGVCNLCNRWVQFIIRHDPDGVFRFAPLQSDVGTELLRECGLSADHLDSLVLVEDDNYYTKSDAALRTATHLGGVFRLGWPFQFVPRRLRDWVYDIVADNRYDWFGKRDQCMMPTPDIEERFLAGGPGSTDAVSTEETTDSPPPETESDTPV